MTFDVVRTGGRGGFWAGCTAGLLLLGSVAWAEDSDQVRPYLLIQRGEFNYAWGMQDAWGLGLGVNLNRYWGIEAVVDNWDDYLEDPVLGTIGEEGVGAALIQGRFRYPLFKDRFVPYAVAGVGGALYQFNDRKPPGFHHDVDADRYGFVASIGGGFDYFLADNIALNLEAKYLYFDPIDVQVDDREFEHDASNLAATIGLRVFFKENEPRPMAEMDEKVPTRLYFGANMGGSFLTGQSWEHGVSLKSESQAWGGVFTQHQGLLLGANFGEVWGVELDAGGGEYTIDGPDGGLSEYAYAGVVPHVRFRWPLEDGRVVPFVRAGMGICYGEDNDNKPGIEGHTWEAKGIYPAASVGGGVEYFIARNISFSGEARWFYSWGHDFTLDGVSGQGEFSNLQLLLGMRLYLVEF
ncbi:MAG: hypothetical protein RI897_2811 [Verrucomicrobiota bacterium]|jgi:opacity protein-like surface antigen